MDPLSVQSAGAGGLRPVAPPSAELGTLLREGRVLAGEILQTFAGGSLLIGVGRHRVPAESEVEMQVGTRFLFAVEEGEEQLVLRVLPGEEQYEPGLLRALRQALGLGVPAGSAGRSIGELLQGLAAALKSEIARGAGTPILRELLVALEDRAQPPSGSAGELRARLVASGLSLEAKLARLALERLPAAERTALSSDLRERWLEALLARGGSAATLATAPAREDLVRLGAELRAVLVRMAAAAGGGAALLRQHGDLSALLALALRDLRGSDLRERASRNLRHGVLPLFSRPLESLALSALLGEELAARRPDGSGGSGATLAEMTLEGDLKAVLQRAALELAEGPSREAARRALAGLEAEQWLSVARRETGEGIPWSVPIAEAGRWATARLAFRRDGEEQGEHGSSAGDDWRMTLDVDFSRIGPLRADLALRAREVSLQIWVARGESLERLSARAGELEQLLALGGRRVSVAVRQAGEERLGQEDLGDIRFLREHPLMDLSG